MSNIHGFHTLNSSSGNNNNPSQNVPYGYGQQRNFAPVPIPSQDVSPEGGLSMMVGPPRADGREPSFRERIFPRASWFTLTSVLSIIQIILFFTELIVGGTKFDGAFVSNNQMGGPSSWTLLYMGGKYGPNIKYQHELWRLITPIFLHAGILHILSNLFFQLRFGFTLEARWGMYRYATIYLVSGIGASLWSTVCSFDSVSVGASGALFGILGADASYLAYNYHQIPHSKQEAMMIAFICAINLLIGIGGDNGVDNYAHVGGFLSGVTFALCIVPFLCIREKESLYRIGSWIAHLAHMILFISLLWGR